VFAVNTARRAKEDWDEHSSILAAVIDGDEDLASMLATRHVRRAAEAAFEAVAKPPRVPSGTSRGRGRTEDRRYHYRALIETIQAN
jgi:hypothetical protein